MSYRLRVTSWPRLLCALGAAFVVAMIFARPKPGVPSVRVMVIHGPHVLVRFWRETPDTIFFAPTDTEWTAADSLFPSADITKIVYLPGKP